MNALVAHDMRTPTALVPRCFGRILAYVAAPCSNLPESNELCLCLSTFVDFTRKIVINIEK